MSIIGIKSASLSTGGRKFVRTGAAGTGLQYGESGKGLDISMYGDTAGRYVLWDASADTLYVKSGASLDVQSGASFKIAGVAVTAAASDLNAMAGAAATTNSPTFIVDADSTAAKLKLDTNSATGNFTLSVVPPNLTGNVVITLPSSTGTLALTSDTATNLDLGASGTPGSLDIFPAVAGNGKLTLTATNMGGAWNLGITNDAIAAARAYKIPDAGGDGKFVLTTSAFSLLVNANAADRTMSLSGNVSLGGALTTAAAVTFAGANALTVNVPAGGSTVTLPSSGVLLSDSGAITGTQQGTFTVDSDSATGTFVLSNTAGGTGHAITLVAPAPAGGAISCTLPLITGILASLAGTQTFAGNKTFTGTVDLQGNVSASAGNPNIDLSASSGTFKPPSGINTFSGALATTGNPDFNWAGSGTFGTPTGTISINGSAVIAANKGLSCAAGTTAVDLSLGSGEFKMPTGALSLNGSATFAADKTLSCLAGATAVDLSLGTGTFKMPTGALSLNGAATFAANKDLACLAGTTAVDLSLGTGTFQTTTGIHTINGVVTLNNATTPSLTCAAGKTNTGFVSVLGKTSGGIKILPIDAGTSLLTISQKAQTQACIMKVPDHNVATGQFVCTDSDFTVKVSANGADRTVSLAGNLTTAAAVTFAGANAATITVPAGGAAITLPDTGTLANTAGAQTLTNKTIDGDDNTVQDISSTSFKVGVANTTPSGAVVIQFSNTGAESQTYTIPVGKTLRVLDVVAFKNTTAGGAADTVQVLSAANPITNAISLNVADNTRVACTTLDDAFQDVAAGVALTCTSVQGTTSGSCRVVVTGMWV